MPARIARSSLPSSSGSRPATSNNTNSKGNRKRKQRSQNAFAIAQKLEPERVKVRQHRLGDVEDDAPKKKRRKMDENKDEDEDEDGSDEEPRIQKKMAVKGRFDELDIEEGSDSEGHEWRMGHVDEDDDSELDSDEAFGESDEEKFEGFTFRGSTGGKGGKAKAKKAKPAAMDLSEGEEEEEDSDADDGDLGGDAVDLAAMLDASEESEEEVGDDTTAVLKSRGKVDVKGASGQDLGQGFESEEEDEEEAASGSDGDNASGSDDDESAYYMSEIDDDENNQDRVKQLESMISSLPKSNRKDVEQESDAENDKPTAESLLAALKSMQGLDPSLTRSIKKLSRSTERIGANKKDGLVQVPLPKRQQDRLDRAAAYDKAKDTLNRWIDTVKHNRRAEHLAFPLVDPHAQEAPGTSKMLPTEHEAPRTDLEATIANILQESGLASKPATFEEVQDGDYDELPANKMSLEEVQARRAELRKARELLQREEARAKRIKKIKSKSFRRVHRKEEQKAAQKERDLMVAAGIDLSEDEKDKNDRRRAEERMGARHRESKWAKGMKQSGRAMWDEDARAGITEMARRKEELTKRMEGTKTRGSDYSDSEVSGDESEGDDFDEEATGFKLRSQLDGLAVDTDSGTKSKLGAMAFMQRADAAQRKRNDEDVERMRRELAGEDSASDAEEETTIGRKLFGPRETEVTFKQTKVDRNELEEGSSSEDDSTAIEAAPVVVNDVKAPAPKVEASSSKARQTLRGPSAKAQSYSDEVFASRQTGYEDSDDSESNEEVKADVAPSNTNGWTKVQLQGKSSSIEVNRVNGYKAAESDESEQENLEAETPIIPSNDDLIKSAFGGDEVEDDFEKEKQDAIESEDEKVVDNTLPGWGSWAGEGISKRELKRQKQRTKGKFLTKTDGIKPEARKDTKLERAIISERRIKKNNKYLASSLPHPFESRAQYERSLRLPIGPEWTTKETFQNATKPRVIVKQGIIKPMSMPML